MPPPAPAAPPAAFWFGDENHPLLGWYHPAQGALRGCGVVLCPPFGHEYLVAYRAYRKLAEQLAAAGFPVCFFDYDGTGESADSDKPRVQAWQDSIVLAMQALKQLSGVPELALFGVRLGALLAASVAATVPTAVLVLVAPVLSGRRYARELQAFARMSPIPPSADPAQAVGDDEVTGYAFDAATQADLGKLDLLKMAHALPAPSFIASRDDMPGQDDKLLAALRGAGKAPVQASAGGYAAMMTEDAFSAQVPAALWDEITGWMVQQPVAATASAQPPALPLLRTTMERQMDGTRVRETLLVFDGLTGVLTEPLAGERKRTAVVFTNIGSSHRVGNHRLHLQWAQQLAAQGFCVLRFDRSGIGYSRPTPEGLENEVYADAGIDDMRRAMDLLASQHGVQDFVLAGLCSGAYFAYHAAVADARVRGLIMVNPLTFQWRPGDTLEERIKDTYKSTGFYLRAALNADTWKRALRGDVALGRIGHKLAERLGGRLRQIGSNARSRWRGAAPQSLVARNFLALQARGVDILFVFAADDSAIDVVYAELGPRASLLDPSKGLRIELVSHTDHTFTPRWSQRHLRQLISGHLAGRF